MTDSEITDIMARAQQQGEVDVHGRTVCFTPHKRGGMWHIFGIVTDTHHTRNFKTAKKLLEKELAGVAL